MTAAEWTRFILVAARQYREGGPESLEDLAAMLGVIDEAKKLLRDKGHDVAGTRLLDVVRELVGE